MTENVYTPRQKHVSDVFLNLANPEKIAILEYIFSTGNPSKYEIIHDLKIAPARASLHLDELEDFGILMVQELKPMKKYTLNNNRWHDYQDLINSFFDKKPAQKLRLLDI